MNVRARVRSWFRSAFQRSRAESEMDAELRFHVEARVEDLVRSGLPLDKAYRLARLEFGGIEQTKEDCREARGAILFESLIQDFRFAFRQLRMNPGFAATAILTLALGIGANTAVFSAVNGVILKPLPYRRPDRLVGIFLHTQTMNRSVMGAADFLALAERQQTFEHVAAFSPSAGFTLTGFGSPQLIPGTAVTSDFFAVLGVDPILGRAFLAEESKPGATPAVVVSHHFWEQFLHADPKALGRSIVLGGKDYSVVGVMPSDFRFGPISDLWPVLQLQPAGQRPPYWLVPVGRLKSGLTEAQAAADATAIAKQVQQQFPNSDDATAITVSMKELFVADVRNALLILLAAVGLVLLIAAVNVANLQLVRAGSRAGEMSIRASLGAGRYRLVRQLLAESIVLSLMGGVLGLGIAECGTRILSAFSADTLPRMNEVTLDTSVLLFTSAIALAAGILFGIVPAFRLSASPVGGSLGEYGRGSTSNRSTRRMHNALVVVEFSLALVVLVGAGLLIRTLFELQAVNPGFSPRHMVTAMLALPNERYAKATEITAFYEQVLERLRDSPGIEAAAISLSLPPNLLELTNPFHIEGEPTLPGQSAPAIPEIPVSTDYFRALGIPLLRGRQFSEADRSPEAHNLLINQNMAATYFPGQDPIGKRLQTGEFDPKGVWYTIVGVVGNVKYEGLGEPDKPAMYVPYFDSGWCPWFVREMYLVVRTGTTTAQATSAIETAVWSLDSELPVAHVKTMDQLLYDSVASSRFRAVLFGVFAALALLLAMIGIYGVVSYSVSQRSQEIGLRMALGAQPNAVLRMVLSQGIGLAIIGILFGLAAAFALSRGLAGLVFGIRPTDPLTFLVVAALLASLAPLACYIPARRATRLDPITTLRYE